MLPIADGVSAIEKQRLHEIVEHLHAARAMSTLHGTVYFALLMKADADRALLERFIRQIKYIGGANTDEL